MSIRIPLSDFSFNNPMYSGAQVTAWVVDVDDFSASDIKATLYSGNSGTNQLTNPITLDGDGKWPRIPYILQSVILEVTQTGLPNHSSGIIPRAGYVQGEWETDTEYWPSDLVTEGDAGTVYQCQVPHTAGTFADDLDAGYWVELPLAGIPEAPQDGTLYGRQDAGWVAAASDARMDSAEAAIAALTGGIAFIGQYDATAHTADYTSVSGLPDGVLVAASAATNKYVIVGVAGTGASPAPVVSLAVGDWLVSDGSAWNKVPLSAQTLAAAQVTISAISGISATTVQGALAEISGDVTAETAARIADVDAEEAARIAAVAAEAATRAAADTALTTAVGLRLQDAAGSLANNNLFYGRRNQAWARVVGRNSRVVSGTSDTPTAANDTDGVIYCTSNSAVTITANDLGQGISYSVQQLGNGQVTIAAGAGVTRVSDKASPSFVTARRGAILTVVCLGDNATPSVVVVGNTA